MKRTIIKIDEALCNGCGACVTGCHEGALQLIDGKAVMVSELYCDGLGACIGECPVGAITLEEREAEPYDERAVMERIAPKGETVILAHLNHLKNHGEKELLRQGLEWLEAHNMKIDMDKKEEKPLACGCPGSMMRDLREERAPAAGGGFVAAGPGMAYTGAAGFAAGAAGFAPAQPQPSELRQFPVQLHLLNPAAPFLQGADLLLAADCTAFACGDFHNRLLKGKMLAVACPKLDSNIPAYID
ncbi:MAG: 4Fe-4S ferredoxin, partial [Rikenellaceae bacterium]|nr:4Fe-4S ferredoxin [Rikenellaceae bacterium]